MRMITEMKSLSIASLTLVTFLSLAGCSNSLSHSSEELEKKSEKQEAIDNVCKYVTPSRISNINGVRIALARLVQIDGSYVPILEEVAEVI